MKLKCSFKGILTPLFSYKEMSLNHESVSNPPKKVDDYRHAILHCSSFDWFTRRNKLICNHATFSLPSAFNKSMKNPRGMIFCHSLIPRFLEKWDSPRICHPFYRQWVYTAPLCITLRIKTWVVAYLKFIIIFLKIFEKKKTLLYATY